MKMHLVKNVPAIKSSELEDWGPVGFPEGEPVSHLSGRTLEDTDDGKLDVGLWECTPGRWVRQVKYAEMCHFHSGRCKFIHDNGEVLEIEAGDTVFFPMNSTGIWDVEETVRKSYMIVNLDG
ncbi:cupin domain-containing protein [Curvivirga sp.]|uniref:cupin domain-containing protein n=1 Tax=Curvivirga sp. TaxID=2856848 RepID=UPI003B59BDF8